MATSIESGAMAPILLYLFAYYTSTDAKTGRKRSATSQPAAFGADRRHNAGLCRLPDRTQKKGGASPAKRAARPVPVLKPLDRTQKKGGASPAKRAARPVPVLKPLDRTQKKCNQPTAKSNAGEQAPPRPPFRV